MLLQHLTRYYSDAISIVFVFFRKKKGNSLVSRELTGWLLALLVALLAGWLVATAPISGRYW